MGYKTRGFWLPTELDAKIAAKYVNFQIGLFNNAATPSDTSVGGDFTETTFSGYTRFVSNNFGGSSLVGSEAIATAPQVSWTVSTTAGSDQIYGYFLYDAVGNFLGAELFPGGPVPMSIAGQILAITPRLTHSNA